MAKKTVDNSAGGDESIELGERAQHLLKVLIDRYTVDGEPVGSRTLARDAGMKLSPATIRNVMADLEEMGFVQSPHTSAGRVPTVQGYRFFVDSLLTVKPLGSREVSDLGAQLEPAFDRNELVKNASGLLSSITGLAGVVTVPRVEHNAIQRIEFLPLSARRVLAILVMDDNQVQNRIVETAREYGRSELEQASNFLSEQFAGHDIHGVRMRLIEEMRTTREDMNRMMMTAIDVAEQVFGSGDSGDDCVIAGQTNLMDWKDLSDLEKLRQLFDAFNEKRAILHLLDECLNGHGIQIFIGEESGFQPLDECSMVTAPYTANGEVVGVLGVIGPTRMAYDRVIPIVDATARLLGQALKPRE